MNNKRSNRILTVLLIAVFCGASAAASQKNDRADAQLQAAIHKDMVEGDLEKAIQLYKEIVAKFSSNRAVTASALFHLGRAYERRGHADAQKTYERIVREYKDQPEVSTQAQSRLGALNVRFTEGISEHLIQGNLGNSTGWSVTADGRWLTMIEESDVVIRDLRLSQVVRRLRVRPEGGWLYAAWLSPDLTQIAYVVQPPRTQGAYGYELRLMANAEGSKPRTLIPNRENVARIGVAWSPDSKSLFLKMEVPAVSIQQGPGMGVRAAIAHLPLADGELRMLPVSANLNGDFDLSPDGQTIAYRGRAADPNNLKDVPIYVFSVGSAKETAVIKSGSNGEPRWSNDGKRLLFFSDRSGNARGLYWIDMEKDKPTGVPHLLKTDVEGMRPIGVTRSGSYFYAKQQAIANDGLNAFVADLDPATGTLRGQPTYLSERFHGWNSAPSWSPDGKLVAFKRRSADNPSRFDLVVRDLASETERTFMAPDWMNPTNGFGPGSPLWLHDSSGFIVGQEPVLNRSSRWLGRLDLKTGVFAKVVEIEKGLGWVSAVSSDDKTAYVLLSKDGTYARVRSMSDFSSSYVGIVAVDLKTGERRDVFMLPGSGAVNSVTLSPDGKTLAFLIFDDGPSRKSTRLARIQIDGTNYKELYATTKSMAPTPDQIQWTKDGRWLRFLEEGRVLRLPVDGGALEFTGLALTRPDRMHPVGSLSPDGSRVAFTDGAPYSSGMEIWALDNLSSIWNNPK